MNPESQQEQRRKKKSGPAPKYDEEFRRQALERMKTCNSVAGLARELGIRRKWLYKWRDQAEGRAPKREPGSKPKPIAQDGKHKQRIAELERLVARQALEIDFFKGALQRIEEVRRKRETSSGAASTSKSGK